MSEGAAPAATAMPVAAPAVVPAASAMVTAPAIPTAATAARMSDVGQAGTGPPDPATTARREGTVEHGVGEAGQRRDPRGGDLQTQAVQARPAGGSRRGGQLGEVGEQRQRRGSGGDGPTRVQAIQDVADLAGQLLAGGGAQGRQVVGRRPGSARRRPAPESSTTPT